MKTLLKLLVLCSLMLALSACDLLPMEGLAVEGVEESVLASDAIAGRSFAGLILRGATEDLAVAATDELASSSTFRAALEELASDARLKVLRSADGYLTIAGTRIGVTEDGQFTLGRSVSGARRIIGEIRNGRLWEVDVVGRPVKAVGEVRAVTRATSVRVRGGPSPDSQILATLQPGVEVRVLQVKNSWFEVAFREGPGVGWVSSSLMEVTALAAGAAIAHPSNPEVAPRSPCAADKLPVAPPKPQTVGYLTMTARAVDLLGADSVRIIVDFANHSQDTRGLAVALKAENSDGIADYWKFFPQARVHLADDLGTEYRFDSATGLPFARDANDWMVLKAGETRPIALVFSGRALGVCLRTYSVSADLWFAFRAPDGTVKRQAITLFIAGLRRDP